MESAKTKNTESPSAAKNVNHSSKNKEKFLLRLPLEVRNYLQAVSYKSCRSMNSEILMRLTHSLANFDSISSDDLTPKESNPLVTKSDNELDTILTEEISKLSVERKQHLVGLLKES